MRTGFHAHSQSVREIRSIVNRARHSHSRTPEEARWPLCRRRCCSDISTAFPANAWHNTKGIRIRFNNQQAPRPTTTKKNHNKEEQSPQVPNVFSCCLRRNRTSKSKSGDFWLKWSFFEDLRLMHGQYMPHGFPPVTNLTLIHHV